jgi:hypothetical protein
LTVANGQTFKRQKNETAERFVKRVTKFEDNKPYTILETKEWDTTKTIVLAFIPTPDEITVGLMFVPTDSFSYRQALVDSFSTYGNTARIDSVFFFNADKDTIKELIIMATYDQSNKRQLTKIYWNLIFDNPDLSTKPERLKYLRQTSKQIDGSKFKKTTDIKTELIKISGQ